MLTAASSTTSLARTAHRSARLAAAALVALAAPLLIDPPARSAIAAPALTAPASAPAAAPAAPVAPQARPLATILLDRKDVRRSTLVGPSGQIYEPPAGASTVAPAPSPARWVRSLAGGVSATITGAARVDGELLVSSAQTPLFHRREGHWQLAQLGQRGRVVFSSGPFFAIAIGRQIFVRAKPPAGVAAAASAPRLLRVGTAPDNVVSLWASGETAIYLVTNQGVFRRRGAAFVPSVKLPGVLGLTGAVPHAVTIDTAINLRTGARVRLTGQTLQIVKSESSPAAILRSATGSLVLARDLTSAAGNVEFPAAAAAPAAPTAAPDPAAPPNAPSSTAPALAAVDAAGRALVVSASGLLVYDGTTWTKAVLTDELPPPRVGPGAARSR
jgi:hypothetical protein